MRLSGEDLIEVTILSLSYRAQKKIERSPFFTIANAS
jgi:hypothetical protein